MSNEKAYEVGYKKPPASGKFKKGKSGNPRGRPKGSLNFSTLLRKELNEPIHITENGQHKRVSKTQAAAKKYSNMAVMGDPKMIPILLRLDDKEEYERAQFAELTHAAPLSSKDKLVMSSIVDRIRQLPETNTAPKTVSDHGASTIDARTDQRSLDDANPLNISPKE